MPLLLLHNDILVSKIQCLSFLARDADFRVHKVSCKRQSSWCYAIAAMSRLLHCCHCLEVLDSKLSVLLHDRAHSSKL